MQGFDRAAKRKLQIMKLNSFGPARSGTFLAALSGAGLLIALSYHAERQQSIGQFP
jgi:hypothetical protein